MQLITFAMGNHFNSDRKYIAQRLASYDLFPVVEDHVTK